MKYKVVEVKKRRFSENWLLGWLFIDKWTVTVEFENGQKKKINLFEDNPENCSLCLLMCYIHSKLTTGNQFKEDLDTWAEKHQELSESLLGRKGSVNRIVGLSDTL